MLYVKLNDTVSVSPRRSAGPPIISSRPSTLKSYRLTRRETATLIEERIE